MDFILEYYVNNMDILQMEQSLLENNMFTEGVGDIKKAVVDAAKAIGKVLKKIIDNVVKFIKGIKDKIINIFIKKKKSELDEAIDEVEDLDIDWDSVSSESFNFLREASMSEFEYKYINFEDIDIEDLNSELKGFKILNPLVDAFCMIPNIGFTKGVTALIRRISKENGDDIDEKSLKQFEDGDYSTIIEDLKDISSGAPDARDFMEDLFGASPFKNVSDSLSVDELFKIGIEAVTEDKKGITKQEFEKIKSDSKDIEKALKLLTKYIDNYANACKKIDSKMDSVIKSCKNDNDIKLFEAVKVAVNEVVNVMTFCMTYQTKYMNIVISNRIDICRKIVAYTKK